MATTIRNLKKEILKLKSDGIAEALRKPAVRPASGVSFSYTPSTTTSEEISRKFKQVVLPQLTMLAQEVELIYNMYAGSTHETDKEAKKQEKELEPLARVHKTLLAASNDVVKYISKNINEAYENPVGAGMGTLPVGDKLADIDKPNDPVSELADVIGTLANLNGDDLSARLGKLGPNDVNNVLKILSKVSVSKEEFGS